MTQKEALEILKMGHNVFLTGAAGSGKTYVLNEYIRWLKERGVEVGVTASTGIAATHIGGQTIHAWSGLGVRDKLSAYDLEDLESKSYLWKRLDRAKVLVIDEVSMLHHFRLDLIEQVLRSFKRSEESFGGLQVILCGDFFQLPPVSRAGERASRFAYEAKAWPSLNLKICYLEEQHRQQDAKYLSILNAIRDNEMNEDLGEHLQSRLNKKISQIEPTKLYSHNVDVDEENERELAKLPGEVYEYYMNGKGKERIVETLKKGCLAPEVLRLKKGARVMFVKNNYEAGFANGTLGIVSSCDSQNIIVRTYKGKLINVVPTSWRIEEEGKVKAEINQYPLRLAWAITVHKSQGLSLDAAEIDLSKSFEKGMGYVALSRVRSLEGLSLKGLNVMALQVDPDVLHRDEEFRRQSQRHTAEMGALDRADCEAKQKRFLQKIGALDGVGKEIKAAKKLSTIDKTKLLLEEGKTLHEMAKERNLNAETILDHLEKIKEGDPTIPMQYLGQDMIVARAKKIRQALSNNGTVSGKYLLGPAKNKLGASFSYEEIRLVRLLM
ncbi:MAG: AAA family ATPase [Candidatus Paceibacterota bacterium]|jgi:ATP-dependent exoDNAse (exonuclease V) alpha subunit